MHYLLNLIVLGVLTSLSFAPSNSSNFATTNLSLTLGLAAQVPANNHDDLDLKKGYAAITKKEDETASINFQLALALSPQNLIEQQANSNGTKFAYDNYMTAGYTATETRDYPTALRQFEQAKILRPDDFYAQEAINNVQSYLARSGEEEKSSKLPTGIFWLLLALAIAFIFLYTLFLVFSVAKPEGEALPEPEKESALKSRRKKVKKRKNLAVKTPENNSFAIEKTTRITNIEIINELISDLQENDPKKRRRAIWELARLGDSRVIKPLVEMMLESNSQERSLILEALSQIGTRTIKPMNQALMISLQDQNPQVRKNAIRDITKIYELMSQVRQLLAHTRNNDPDQEVRETAYWAMEKLNLIQLPPPGERLSPNQNIANSLDMSAVEENNN
ncbi:MAG: HEAT repeat domain-containing protein [Gomphosphaeria aponina SAG 52.96 = DSM 107014]|uniref:HEAT repeat domain-containing protein n=1 Tax=Gomphosphaeria aponina SAG 52.96 = DSM 107014 TaxID=1521640 RepID=A0A941GSR1_9CHRO|nr:HEAT repeat domain-containing protein [Gomphosphaeria aponina SAG 52.96 = DSM 107014]